MQPILNQHHAKSLFKVPNPIILSVRHNKNGAMYAKINRKHAPANLNKTHKLLIVNYTDTRSVSISLVPYDYERPAHTNNTKYSLRKIHTNRVSYRCMLSIPYASFKYTHMHTKQLKLKYDREIDWFINDYGFSYDDLLIEYEQNNSFAPAEQADGPETLSAAGAPLSEQLELRIALGVINNAIQNDNWVPHFDELTNKVTLSKTTTLGE